MVADFPVVLVPSDETDRSFDEMAVYAREALDLKFVACVRIFG